jgi:hypothetical protein
LPALVLAARTAWRALRVSRLRRPVVFELPAVPDASAIYAETVPDIEIQMAGRDVDTASFFQLVNERPLVLLRGTSGAGKSTFLKLGLGRALHHSGRWLPIYVDSWRSDWQDGPWTTLFDALSLALRNLPENERTRIAAALSTGAESMSLFTDSQKLFEILPCIRPATGRRPVILFDQIDTYIDLFESSLIMPDTNRSLDPDELCQRNQFWRRVRDVCRSADPVHCIIAARSESSRIECFQFAHFHSRPLMNLSQAAAFGLIQTLGKDAVSNPENGFDELSRRLSESLSRNSVSVLAIELRVVLAGLASPNGKLTARQIEKSGGIGGLAAQWLRHQISGAQLDERNVLALLLQLVNSAQPQTIPVPIGGLRYSGELTDCLNELERRRVLRVRFRGTPDEEWQLYHSYLAAAILSLEERLAQWRIYLERAEQEYREASWTGKWTRLIPPHKQLALFWNRLRRRVRFGKHAAFVGISTARLVMNSMTIGVLTAILAMSWWSDSQAAQALLNGFDADSDHALWALTRARPHVKAMFLEGAFYRAATLDGLESRMDDLVTSIGFQSEFRTLAQNLITSGPACHDPVPPKICSGLAVYVDRPELSRLAAQQILDRLERVEDDGPAAQMGEALSGVAAGSPDLAKQGAQLILDRLVHTDNGDDRASSLGNTLALLAKRSESGFAANGVTHILGLLMSCDEKFRVKNLSASLAALVAVAGQNSAARALATLDSFNGEKSDWVRDARRFVEFYEANARPSRAKRPTRMLDLFIYRKDEFAFLINSTLRPEQIPALIDLLKWPADWIAGNRIVLAILQIKGVPPEQFGFFDKDMEYNPHIWQFADWARKQKYELDSPPVGPDHFAEKFGYLFPK